MFKNSVLWVDCSDKVSYVPNVDSISDLAVMKNYGSHASLIRKNRILHDKQETKNSLKHNDDESSTWDNSSKENNFANNKTDAEAQPFDENSPGRKSTLKDLCFEDKQRIANLIRELAKLGDDKVSFEQQLLKERETFSEQFNDLVEEKKQIENEYQEMISKYHATQKLLTSYQNENIELYNEVSRKMNTIPAMFAETKEARACSMSQKAEDFVLKDTSNHQQCNSGIRGEIEENNKDKSNDTETSMKILQNIPLQLSDLSKTSMIIAEKMNEIEKVQGEILSRSMAKASIERIKTDAEVGQVEKNEKDEATNCEQPPLGSAMSSQSYSIPPLLAISEQSKSANESVLMKSTIPTPSLPVYHTSLDDSIQVYAGDCKLDFEGDVSRSRSAGKSSSTAIDSSVRSKNVIRELPPAFFSTRLTPSPPDSRYRNSSLHSTTRATSFSRLTQENLSNISEIIDAMDDSSDDENGDIESVVSTSSLRDTSSYCDDLLESVFFVK